MEKTTLYLPADLQLSLRAAARRTGRSQAELVREALTEYLGRQQRPRPKSIGIIREEAVPPARDVKGWVRREWDREASERADY
jgi:plasmid stability protein